MFGDNSKYLEALIENASIDIAERLFFTVLFIAIVWIIRKLILRFIRKKASNERTKFIWNKYSYYVFFAISLIIIFDLWFKGFNNVITLFGLIAAGIAFALKEPIVNLFGWVYIIWRGPIKTGDRIEIDNHYGDVIEVTPFHFDMFEIRNWIDGDLYTGRVISIPNAKVFNYANSNYSSGYKSIWNETKVTVTFESDWKKAKEILLEIAKENSNYQDTQATFDAYKTLHAHEIHNVEFEPTVFTRIVKNGVELRVRYFCSIYNRTTSEANISEAVLEKFNAEATITFAYPTTRFYTGE
jgi:small-conductance mechanosensitive channel